MFFPFFLESGAAFGCGRLFFGGGGDVPPFLPVPDLLQRARGGRMVATTTTGLFETLFIFALRRGLEGFVYLPPNGGLWVA